MEIISQMPGFLPKVKQYIPTLIKINAICPLLAEARSPFSFSYIFDLGQVNRGERKRGLFNTSSGPS